MRPLVTYSYVYTHMGPLKDHILIFALNMQSNAREHTINLLYNAITHSIYKLKASNIKSM